MNRQQILLQIDRHSDTPLYRQVYRQIRQQILQGQIAPGTKLPTTRAVATYYTLGRVTITTAYQQLQAEGYLVSRPGAGTFVADELPLAAIETGQPAPFTPQLSRWGQRLLDLGALSEPAQPPARPDKAPPNGRIDFGFGRTFPHIFPYDVWRRLLARYLSTDDVMLARYGSVAGFLPLREAVANYLGRLRGVRCRAEQVVIVSGMQQALDILARLLLNAGDEVVVETPGYVAAFDLFRWYGATLTAVPVDDQGLPVERLSPSRRVRLAFVTPSNQFPKGGAMPLARRLALLQWAREAGAMILEDDYDGELRYTNHPLAALQGLDNAGRVVYLGTFSKVLFPALRLGYVVLPDALLEPFLQIKGLIDLGSPTLTQAAVADFITEGHFERHLRRLRQEYGRRWRVLANALDERLGDRVRYVSEGAGLQVMLYLPPEADEQEVIKKAAAAGVGVYPGAPYHLEQPPPPSILLGFSGLSDKQIEEGIGRLARAL